MKWALAAIALTLGALAPFAGSPYKQKEVSAVDLAFWIRDRKPGLRVIDLRSQQEFDAAHVPTSIRATAIRPAENETIVVVAGNDVRFDHPHVYVLRGGIAAWTSEVAKRNSAIGRYFGGVRRGGC